MTATLEQIQSDLLRLLILVQQGEEVVITNQGRAVAKLSPVPQTGSSPSRQAWLARLRQLRADSATGRTSIPAEDILDGLRSERG